MLNRMIINPIYSSKLVDSVFILSSSKKNITITDPKAIKILSRVSEGVSSEEDLIDSLETLMPMPEVLYILDKLERNDIVIKASDIYPEEEALFWLELGIVPSRLTDILRNNPVSISSIHCEDHLKIFQDTFAGNRIEISRNGKLDLFIIEDYEQQELQRINLESLDKGNKWMLVKPYGTFICIGPLFEPGKTGCWKCLDHRVKLNHGVNDFYRIDSGSKIKVVPAIPYSIQIAASITCLEIIKYLYFSENKNIEGNILSIDMAIPQMHIHPLVKRPQCSDCGTPEIIHSLQDKFVTFEEDNHSKLTVSGGFRTVSPEVTFEMYKHHISPITGIVQVLNQIKQEEDAPVFNYFSGTNTTMASPSNYRLNNHIRRYSMGKGRNTSQAKTGALCEAIERYSCIYQGDENVFSSSFKNLGKEAIHPYKCLNFSETQYKHRSVLNSNCQKKYLLIPAEFDEQKNMDWVKMYLIGSSEYKYIPAAYCFFNYPESIGSEACCYADSNGNAAGNTMEEAILQGLFELIERDSVAIWWYNRLNCPSVDIASFEDSYFNELLRYYKTIDRELYAIDLSFDIGIPCFAAISHDMEGGKMIVGFGAHVDAKIALERALTEMNQLLPILSGNKYLEDPVISDWIKNATIDNQPYLKQHNLPVKTTCSYSADPLFSTYEAIRHCQAKLAQSNMECYFINFTKPDIGLPVVKVIVPGLRHFWTRFGPGRLYDVPVKLNLLNKRKNEEELNPIPFFL